MRRCVQDTLPCRYRIGGSDMDWAWAYPFHLHPASRRGILPCTVCIVCSAAGRNRETTCLQLLDAPPGPVLPVPDSESISSWHPVHLRAHAPNPWEPGLHPPRRCPLEPWSEDLPDPFVCSLAYPRPRRGTGSPLQGTCQGSVRPSNTYHPDSPRMRCPATGLSAD